MEADVLLGLGRGFCGGKRRNWASSFSQTSHVPLTGLSHLPGRVVEPEVPEQGIVRVEPVVHALKQLELADEVGIRPARRERERAVELKDGGCQRWWAANTHDTMLLFDLTKASAAFSDIFSRCMRKPMTRVALRETPKKLQGARERYVSKAASEQGLLDLTNARGHRCLANHAR